MNVFNCSEIRSSPVTEEKSSSDYATIINFATHRVNDEGSPEVSTKSASTRF